MCVVKAAFVQQILGAYGQASRLTHNVEFVELVPTTHSLQAAYKRQMLNSFYLRPGLDTCHVRDSFQPLETLAQRTIHDQRVETR